MISADFALALLRRVEDAGLNASAPPQQLWMDGWIVRLSPGKAKRARCINAVAAGQLPLDEQLARCAARFAQAGLPLVARITPFTQPPGLDAHLAGLGWAAFDDTRVMVLQSLDALPDEGCPAHLTETLADPQPYAQAVGALRGSSPTEIAAHAERLAASPVPYTGLVWTADAPAGLPGGEVVACGQFAREGDLVGLYDVFTAPAHRGQGLARTLCASLLHRARQEGATSAYLQVDSANAPARAVYSRLGFRDGYRYHYRSAEASDH